jgi:hypothetical protein
MLKELSQAVQNMRRLMNQVFKSPMVIDLIKFMRMPMDYLWNIDLNHLSIRGPVYRRRCWTSLHKLVLPVFDFAQFISIANIARDAVLENRHSEARKILEQEIDSPCRFELAKTISQILNADPIRVDSATKDQIYPVVIMEALNEISGLPVDHDLIKCKIYKILKPELDIMDIIIEIENYGNDLIIKVNPPSQSFHVSL